MPARARPRPTLASHVTVADNCIPFAQGVAALVTRRFPPFLDPLRLAPRDYLWLCMLLILLHKLCILTSYILYILFIHLSLTYYTVYSSILILLYCLFIYPHILVSLFFMLYFTCLYTLLLTCFYYFQLYHSYLGTH